MSENLSVMSVIDFLQMDVECREGTRMATGYVSAFYRSIIKFGRSLYEEEIVRTVNLCCDARVECS